MKKRYCIPIIGLLICGNNRCNLEVLKRSCLFSWIIPAAIALGLAIWLL